MQSLDLTGIKENIDLVSIIQDAGVDLKRSGSRHVGRCPFHEDREPSLFVFPDNRFKCFGCGEHGDAVDFIQKYHSVDFKGALQTLGIEQSKLTSEKQQEIKRVQHRRELAKAFRRWEAVARDEVGTLCRCARKLLGNIKTEADLDRVGGLYHGLESWQYHLDILSINDDEAKVGLYDAGYYN